ncbi:MAG: SDR family NAD(P)-dependent oxidoreductase [Pseudomonadota bacterium]
MMKSTLHMDIADKSILVTGANRGVGRALVDEALRRGAMRVFAGSRGAFRHPDARVTRVALDVTSPEDIQRAAAEVGALDLLVNNAGISLFDDLSDPGSIDTHMDVNFHGPYRMVRAFLPHLKRSRGAIVNVLSLAALAPVPVTPSYSISKAAAHSLTQTLRAYLAGDGVAVHAVMLGPVDTDMTRGFDIPKASPAAVARSIFDALERGDEDIFPDPLSQPMAEGWRSGVVKAFEHQYAGFLPASVAINSPSNSTS